jgi:hypothetical protein
MRGNTMCLCGVKRGYDPEMTKYAVDTLTAYRILTLALSYTYKDYTRPAALQNRLHLHISPYERCQNHRPSRVRYVSISNVPLRGGQGVRGAMRRLWAEVSKKALIARPMWKVGLKMS